MNGEKEVEKMTEPEEISLEYTEKRGGLERWD